MDALSCPPSAEYTRPNATFESATRDPRSVPRPKVLRVASLRWFGAVAALLAATTAHAAVSYVQGNSAVPQTSQTSVAVIYTAAQTAGNTNIVVVGWHDSTATVSSITDTKGNSYVIAVGPTVSSTHGSETIYYASGIIAAAASANTVTVTFSVSASKPDIRIAEYSGLVATSALDHAVGATGTTGTSLSSGSISTTYANDLVVGADLGGVTTSAAGSGYTQRILTTTDKDLLEDKTVTTTGSYSATATLTSSSWWIMQVAAFKVADVTAPTAPTALTGTVASATQINLSWTASTDNIGVTAYKVERCQGASCSSFAQITSVSGTTYNDTPLAPSTSYSYRVRATDAAGNLSAYSSTVTKVTSADTTAPTVPTGFTATTASATQVNLSWTASTDNVGVTAYRVERCQGASCSTFAQIASVTTGTTFNDTPLSPTTSYSYRIRAADAASNLSGYSTTSTAVTSADTTPPSAPTGLGATAASATQINLSWTAATDNVGVTGYRVERCQGASCSSFAQIATLAAVTTYSDTPLSPTASYSYRVRAVDAAGNLGAYSGTGTAVTPADTTAPSAPTGLGATAASATQINLSWTASTDNVGVTAYRVERCQGASCSSYAQIASVTTGTTYSDTPLSPSTSYSYRVRAADAAGNLSGYSGTSTASTPADTTAPSAPTGLGASATSSSQINLSWTASTDNVGVTQYLVEQCQGVSCSTFAQIATVTTGTTYSATGLVASTSYSYRLRASDAANNLSAYSGTATAVTQAGSDTQPPTTPTNLGPTKVLSAETDLAWQASTDNVAVTAYLVERCQGTGCSTFAQIASVSSGTTYADTTLAAGTVYGYRVRATDAASNLSGYSNVMTVTTGVVCH